MKRNIVLIAIIFLVISIKLYSQDTLSYITSACLGPKSGNAKGCPPGINFKYYNDTLEIYGEIKANCCGTHLVIISKKPDTTYISTIDTGQLCNCLCDYCFDIKIKASVTDTIVNINGKVYNSLLSSMAEKEKECQMNLYPNPAYDNLMIIYKGKSEIKGAAITDISGRILRRYDNPKTSINIRGISAGVYFIIFHIENSQQLTKKIAVSPR